MLVAVTGILLRNRPGTYSEARDIRGCYDPNDSARASLFSQRPRHPPLPRYHYRLWGTSCVHTVHSFGETCLSTMRVGKTPNAVIPNQQIPNGSITHLKLPVAMAGSEGSMSIDDHGRQPAADSQTNAAIGLPTLRAKRGPESGRDRSHMRRSALRTPHPQQTTSIPCRRPQPNDQKRKEIRS